MIKTYELVYGLDPEYGVWGLKIIGTSEKYIVANSGTLIAHDVIEHKAIEEIGGIADELMALGASWITRGQYSDFPNNASNSYEIIANGITTTFEDFINNNYNYDYDVSTLPSLESLEDDYVRESIDIILEKVNLDSYNEDQEIVDEFIKNARILMCMGAEEIQIRLPNVCENTIFNSVRIVVDELLEDLPHDINISHYELVVNYETAQAEINPVYHEL